MDDNYENNRASDNVFVHSFEERGSGQEITTREEVLPDEYPLPDFLGFFPSWSPSQAPTVFQNTIPYDGFATTTPYMSADEIYTKFASSCPLLSLGMNQEILPLKTTDTWDSKLVMSLKRFLLFQRNDNFEKEHDLDNGEKSLSNAAEATLVWMVVSLGLGLWFIVLCKLRKAKTAKTNERSSRKLRRRLRQPSLEHYCLKEWNHRPPFETLPVRVSTRDINDRIKYNKRIDGHASPSLSGSHVPPKGTRIPQEPYTNNMLCIKSEVKTMERQCSGISNEKPSKDLITVDSEKGKPGVWGNDKGRVSDFDFNEKHKNLRQEHKIQEEPYFLPVLPILSDLSMPPGLSKSSSSSSSSSSRSFNDERVAMDNVSIAVLATDDIYTGSTPASLPVCTHDVNYLTYCLQEFDSEGVARKKNHLKLDNDSETLLLSCGSMNSSASNSSKESCSSFSRNMELLEFARFEQNRGPIRSNVEVRDISVPARRESMDDNVRMHQMDSSESQMLMHETGKYGRAGADCIGGDNGTDDPSVAFEPVLKHASSLKQVISRKRLNGQSQNLEMLLQCDDSNTTIDLLADSSSSHGSVENVDSIDVHRDRFINSRKRKQTGLPLPSHLGEKNALTIDKALKKVEKTRIDEIIHKTIPELSAEKRTATCEMSKPMTEDLEALLFGTGERRRMCGRKNQNGVGSMNQCFLGSLRRKRVAIIVPCVLLILSVLVFVATGISELYSFHETIENQFNSLMKKITKPFVEFDDDELYGFSTELDRRTHQLYGSLHDHCPRISTELCGYNFDPAYASSSSCNLNGIPFDETWKELLLVTDQVGHPMTSSLQNDSSHSISEWLIIAKYQSLSISSTLQKRFQNEAKKWKWCLSIALLSGIGMSVLAISVLSVLSYPTVEKSWGARWIEKLPYLKFGEDNRDSLSWNANGRFDFCTERIFGTIFWSLFAAIWLFGMVFSIMTVATVDVCDAELPNPVLDNEFEEWKERIPGHDFYITEFWQQQLRYCRQEPIIRGQISIPAELTDRIELLLQLAGPLHDITEGLRNLSSSGFFLNVCGRDVGPVLQVADEMASQVCSDAEFVTNAYLELMSCDHSSWLPLYNRMMTKTICTHALSGLTWATVMQVSILFFSLVLWVYRPFFLVSTNTNM